jgi:hypothetical protein
MLSETNRVISTDFCKSEELKYQISQLKYHTKWFKRGLEEALHHLNEATEIVAVLKDIQQKLAEGEQT